MTVPSCQDVPGSTRIFARADVGYMDHFQAELAPVVSLDTPLPGAVLDQSDATLTYAVSDATAIWHCDLYVDGAPVVEESSVERGVSQEFLATLSNGQHSWQVSCYDVWDNLGVSETRMLTVAVVDLGTCDGGVNDGQPCDPANGNADCEDGVNNGTCVPSPSIPAVSSWGLAAMLLLLLTAGTLVFWRRTIAAYP